MFCDVDPRLCRRRGGDQRDCLGSCHGGVVALCPTTCRKRACGLSAIPSIRLVDCDHSRDPDHCDGWYPALGHSLIATGLPPGPRELAAGWICPDLPVELRLEHSQRERLDRSRAVDGVGSARHRAVGSAVRARPMVDGGRSHPRPRRNRIGFRHCHCHRRSAGDVAPPLPTVADEVCVAGGRHCCPGDADTIRIATARPFVGVLVIRILCVLTSLRALRCAVSPLDRTTIGRAVGVWTWFLAANRDGHERVGIVGAKPGQGLFRVRPDRRCGTRCISTRMLLGRAESSDGIVPACVIVAPCNLE